jgi:hypothetical protein
VLYNSDTHVSYKYLCFDRNDGVFLKREREPNSQKSTATIKFKCLREDHYMDICMIYIQIILIQTNSNYVMLNIPKKAIWSRRKIYFDISIISVAFVGDCF